MWVSGVHVCTGECGGACVWVSVEVHVCVWVCGGACVCG